MANRPSLADISFISAWQKHLYQCNFATYVRMYVHESRQYSVLLMCVVLSACTVLFKEPVV